MAKHIFTIELPDEILDVLKDMGFDPKSYLSAQFLSLLDRVKEAHRVKLLKNKEQEIDDKLTEVKKAIKIKAST